MYVIIYNVVYKLLLLITYCIYLNTIQRKNHSLINNVDFLDVYSKPVFSTHSKSIPKNNHVNDFCRPYYKYMNVHKTFCRRGQS